jgi:hypothetical protein
VQLPDNYKPKVNPWIIAVTVTLATIMEVLDTSISRLFSFTRRWVAVGSSCFCS